MLGTRMIHQWTKKSTWLLSVWCWLCIWRLLAYPDLSCCFLPQNPSPSLRKGPSSSPFSMSFYFAKPYLLLIFHGFCYKSLPHGYPVQYSHDSCTSFYDSHSTCFLGICLSFWTVRSMKAATSSVWLMAFSPALSPVTGS